MLKAAGWTGKDLNQEIEEAPSPQILKEKARRMHKGNCTCEIRSGLPARL